MPPLLEIVTRSYKRPDMLAANVASLRAQTCPDWAQTILADEVGIGVAAANARLAAFGPVGLYVWVLDDDDLCIDRTLVETLQRIADVYGWPPAIMVRMDHGPLGILPDPVHWGEEPVCGNIGASAIITRRDVWIDHCGAWASGRYESDFDFIRSVWSAYAGSIVWHPKTVARVQKISRGAAQDA